MMLVLRHLHDIDTRLRLAPQDWQPVFSVANADDLDLDAAPDANDDAGLADELADARDWCAGFLDACELDPEGWEARFDDTELGPQLMPIAVLGGGADLGDKEDEGDDDEMAAVATLLDDPLEVDRLSRAAAEVVVLLYQRRQAA
jgi:uncharacterized protein